MNEKLTKEEIMAALNERHSPEKQALLSEGRVAIAGLGGLGSNVAYALARIGVGHLHLIDFDVVDITNLNRQQYFMEHLGMYKTDALKSLLLKINPYLDIHITYSDYLNGKVEVVGRPLNSFFSYRFAGLDSKDGRPMFSGTEVNYTVNGEEVLDEAGKVIKNKDRYVIYMFQSFYLFKN